MFIIVHLMPCTIDLLMQIICDEIIKTYLALHHPDSCVY